MPFASILTAFNQSAPLVTAMSPRVFAGAVQDSYRNPVGLPGKVVLLIGINFGQTGTSGSKPITGKLAISTQNPPYNYYAKVDQMALKYGLKSPEYLVFWNFFPYLTTVPWSKFAKNCYVEANCLFQSGYKNPICECKRLIGLLESNLNFIVFHGVDCFVPHGAQLVRPHYPAIKMFITDNLSSPKLGSVYPL